MKQRRHTPEQIIRKLREAERLQAEGADIATLRQAPGGHRADVPPLAGAVRRREGRPARRRDVQGPDPGQ